MALWPASFTHLKSICRQTTGLQKAFSFSFFKPFVSCLLLVSQRMAADITFSGRTSIVSRSVLHAHPGRWLISLRFALIKEFRIPSELLVRPVGSRAPGAGEGRSDSDSQFAGLCFLRESLNYFSGLDSGVHSPVL